MQSEKCQVDTHLKSIKIIQILRVCCEIWTPVIILLSLLFSLVDASMVVWTTFNKNDNTHYLSRVKQHNKHKNPNREGEWR